MRLTITKKLYSKTFRFISLDFWKRKEDLWVEKLHIKIPLTLYTWKICMKAFPGSVFVWWNKV